MDANSPTLDRIRGAGVLRVGTTGDYTPFSLKRPDGSYQGADIEMAHDFGRAEVTIHHDNASVFLEIVEGRADVMVTDGLEADHQAALHPELCAVPVAPFTRLEKAYMFARDPAMKRFIDDWLGARFAGGAWQLALEQYPIRCSHRQTTTHVADTSCPALSRASVETAPRRRVMAG